MLESGAVAKFWW